MEICRELGRSDASLVPDPTLLLSVHDYSSIAAPCLYSQDYLLLYLLGNEIDFDGPKFMLGLEAGISR